ncbi:hypothetical protein MASR2M15_17560 [Anaerolineales bacterium]
MLEKIKNLDLLTIFCPNLSEIRGFYSDILRFHLYEDTNTYLEYLIGSTRLRFLKDPLRKTSGLMLSLQVNPDDLQACYDQILDHNAEICASPTTSADGKRFICFADPIGNQVEIFTQLPGDRMPSILSMLTVAQALQLSPHCELLEFQPGQVIINQGDIADRFYMITSGRVQIVNYARDGHEITGGWLSSGDYFGEVGLLQSHERTATIRASEDGVVKLIALDKQAFEELLQESTSTTQNIYETMYKRLMDTAGRIILDGESKKK